MTINLARHAAALGYAGLIPFIGPAFLVWVLPETQGLEASQLFISYSAIILSFLGGMLWAFALSGHAAHPVKAKLITVAVLFSLIAWCASSFLPAQWAGLALLISYKLVRLVEQNSVDQNYPLWFIELRNRLTITVFASHISVWVFLLQV